MRSAVNAEERSLYIIIDERLCASRPESRKRSIGAYSVAKVQNSMITWSNIFHKKNKMKIFFLFIFPFIRIFGMIRSPLACGSHTFASAKCVTCKSLDGTLADAKNSSRPSSRNACGREHRVPAYRMIFYCLSYEFLLPIVRIFTTYRTIFYYLSYDFLLPIERFFTTYRVFFCKMRYKFSRVGQHAKNGA